MDRESLLEAIEASPLANHIEFLLANAAPMVRIKPRDKNDAGRSCIAGSPNLPTNFSWPECEPGYRFMMQLDFAEMPPCVSGQPDAGVLSFFLEHNDDNSNDWWSPECLKVFYFAGSDELVTAKAPNGVPSFDAFPIAFEHGWDLPFLSRLVKDSYENTPISFDDLNDYEDLRDSLHIRYRFGEYNRVTNFCFGHPMDTCLCQNPLPGPDWMQLVNIDTHEDLGLFFMDHARFMVFVETKRFAVQDFSNLKPYAG